MGIILFNRTNSFFELSNPESDIELNPASHESNDPLDDKRLRMMEMKKGPDFFSSNSYVEKNEKKLSLKNVNF